MTVDKLKAALDRFYRTYPFEERILRDPIEFPHRYRHPRDVEVSAFIASSLAYGRVDLFKDVIRRVLSRMGESPYDFILNFSVRRQARLFKGIKYRFNENDDLVCLLFLLSGMLKRYSSLESAFKKFYSEKDEDIGKGLTGLVGEFLRFNTSPVYRADIRPRGLRQLFPSPASGSTCKRANLFLRWMIRDKDIDLGIWEGIPKNKLVIPLDTHIARISRCLGLTQRRSQDWKTAVEITVSLKKFDAEDPLKYDFALCHQGISGACREAQAGGCSDCVFASGRQNLSQ